jgi:hypothetical protein
MAAPNIKTLDLKLKTGQTEAQVIAMAALTPAVNAAYVVESFQGNILGSGADFMALVDGLEKATEKSNNGDLSNVEAMLIGQAMALESIFTSLAKRASGQTQLPHYQAFFGMAMKAQAQSRATLAALVDLKYPRQATFVKQANIAHGPQQVNNGAALEPSTHASETQTPHNELLEDHRHGSTHLDSRATTAPTRSRPAVEAVAPVHGATKRRRKGGGIP